MRPLAAVVGALLCLTTALPALGQDAETEPSVRLVVAGLSSVIGPGTVAPDAGEDAFDAAERVVVRVLVENTGDVPVDDLRLSVEVFDAITFRSTTRTALDEDDPRSRLRQLRSEFLAVRDGDELPPGDVAAVTFASTAAELGIARAGGAGVVFPVRLSVVEGIDPLDQVTTSVIYLRAEAEVPLATVVGWPLDDEPWRRPGGAYPVGVDRTVAAGGRLERLLAAAEAHPDVPLTFLPAAHLLEDLIDRSDGFATTGEDDDRIDVAADALESLRAGRILRRIRERLGAAVVDPVVAAYADADIAGLVQAPDPLDDEAASAVARGRVRLATALGRVPDQSTYWTNTRIDRETLDVLASQTATERVLLPFEHLGYEGDLDRYPADLPTGVLQLTSSSGRRVRALVPDPYVDRALRDPDQEHGPIVAAQRVLAETAVLWTELPLTPRPLVIMPPPGWDPFGRYADALLDAFRSAPWLSLQAPSQLDDLEPAGDAFRLPADAGGLPSLLLEPMLQARLELAAVQEAVPGEDGEIAGRAVDELELQLLRAPSAWFAPGDTGLAMVEDVRDAIAEAYGQVEVAEGARITLTSDTGQIPVTVQRPTGGPLDVVIAIEETRANLEFPVLQRRVTLPGTGAQTFSFPVIARSTGSFGVTVRVTDPAGVRQLASGTITIRSTAISGPALTGTAVVVVLLLLFGFARRRPDRPKLEVVS